MASPSETKVERLRWHCDAMLAARSLRPATRQWVGSLFDRGLKLADEIDLSYADFYRRLPGLSGFNIVRCDALTRWPCTAHVFELKDYVGDLNEPAVIGVAHDGDD